MYKCRDKYRNYQKQYQKNYYRRKRDEAISALGGVCSQCGSRENLEFDHIKHTSKEASVSKIIKCGDERLSAELSKCQVLCKECHLNKSIGERSLAKNTLRGSQIVGAKLNEASVIEIRKEVGKVTDTSLAHKYQVSRETIRDIRVRRTWVHI